MSSSRITAVVLSFQPRIRVRSGEASAFSLSAMALASGLGGGDDDWIRVSSSSLMAMIRSLRARMVFIGGLISTLPWVRITPLQRFASWSVVPGSELM